MNRTETLKSKITDNVSNQQTEPPRFLTAKEGAAFLRLSQVTLARWRGEGVGPRYRKFGRRVVYAKVDLLRWADGQIQHNTSQLPACQASRR